MAFATSVGYPPVIWDVDITWPWIHTALLGAQPDQNLGLNGAPWLSSTSLGTAGRAIISQDSGAAGLTKNMVVYRGARAVQYAATAANVNGWIWGAIPPAPPINGPNPMDPGFTAPRWMRAAWLQAVVAINAGATPNDGSGVALVAANGPIAGGQFWPVDGGPDPLRGMFGFVGDGAGGWLFNAYDSAFPANLLTSIAVPPPPVAGGYQLLELFVTGATSTSPATVDVYVDGVKIAAALRFTSAAGGLWDSYAMSGADRWNLETRFRGAAAHATDWVFQSWRLRCGGFTRDGVPLT